MNNVLTLADCERRKLEVAQDIKSAKEQSAKILQSLEFEWREADRQARYIVDNIDSAKILLAEHVINVGGLYEKAGDEKSAVREQAIKYLLDGGKSLKSAYVGTKDYDRWHGQAIECEYGMGPRHGSVIFRIELVREQRQREGLLSAEEIDAAIYYLRNLERIQALHQQTKTAQIAP